ncbi:MAG: hypothetical protein ACKOHN_01395 [Actinomycetota bacterium]
MSKTVAKTAIVVSVLGLTVSGLGASAATGHTELVVTNLSDQFTILDVDESGLVGSPDGHITFLRENGSLRFWAPINGGTVELSTTDFYDLHSTTDPAVEVLEPTGPGPSLDSEYAGGSKVLQLPDGRLAMIYHGEHHPCSGDKAEVTIALATSSDNGATWDRRGAIVTAPPFAFGSCDERTFFGAGSFSGVVSPDRNYLYLYYNQWSPEESGVTKVVRARIADGLVPGTWFKWYHGRWREPGLGGRADDVLPVPSTPTDQEWRAVAIPTVSWNTEYRMWMAVFVSVTGFWYSSSPDGLHWSEPRSLIEDVVLYSPRSLVDHEQYIYYPSLIDVNADEDGRTSGEALLIYAQGGWTSAHHMVGRTMTISKMIVPDLPTTGGRRFDWWASILLVFGLGLRRFVASRASRPTGRAPLQEGLDPLTGVG